MARCPYLEAHACAPRCAQERRTFEGMEHRDTAPLDTSLSKQSSSWKKSAFRDVCSASFRNAYCAIWGASSADSLCRSLDTSHLAREAGATARPSCLWLSTGAFRTGHTTATHVKPLFHRKNERLPTQALTLIPLSPRYTPLSTFFAQHIRAGRRRRRR